MSMHIGPSGGAYTDLETSYDFKESSRDGWVDGVEFKKNYIQVPGREDHVDMGGDPIAVPRRVIVRGSVTGTDLADLESNRQGINAAVLTNTEREFYFSDTGSDIVARGVGIRVRYQEARPILLQLVSFVTIEILCKDPRRYDISGGQPGTAID
jgi:hypothetical protein